MLLKSLLKNIFFLSISISLSIATKAQEIDWTFKNPKLSVEERAEILVSQMTVDEKISQLMNDAPAIERLEVPQYNWWNEALHGVARNGKATIFPQGIAIGASFDTDLAYRVASAISTEAVAKYTISQEAGNRSKYAGLTFWTPNINIFRDPRWGRGQETYGEDPFLTSEIGVAFVKGLQGNHKKYLKSAACAKHFAVHSGPEEVRHTFNAIPTKKDLYETYLPAFEALVTKAKVEGVMGAYNAVYGVPSCANEFLLKDVLKDQWNFDGYITSDCGAIGGMTYKMKYTESLEKAAALSLQAGLNMNCGQSFGALKKALDNNLITEELIHKRTVQLYKTLFRLGMFDSYKKNPYRKIDSKHIHSKAHIALAREAAQKSIVLLKNSNHTLPLSKNIKVPYITGPFANSADMLMGSYYGISPNLVTVLEGIADKVSLSSSLNYRSGALPFQKNINPKNWAPFVAGESDVTICVVGITADMEGEEVDAIASANIGDRIDLKLPENQINYIKQMAEKKKGPLVLLIASGSPVSLEGIEEYCDAILQIWYPGEQGGNAVADILFGDVSPSGKLPITFPKNVDQLPSYEDYSMSGRTYKFMSAVPLYPFGFGLSYTTFEYGDLNVSKQVLTQKESIDISFTVKNTGERSSDDIAQLYLIPLESSIPNTPKYILKRFERIENLQPERSKKVSFSLTAEDFQLFNEKGEKVWLKGKYKLVAANALPSNRSKQLGAASFSETILELK